MKMSVSLQTLWLERVKFLNKKLTSVKVNKVLKVLALKHITFRVILLLLLLALLFCSFALKLK